MLGEAAGLKSRVWWEGQEDEVESAREWRAWEEVEAARGAGGKGCSGGGEAGDWASDQKSDGLAD